MENKTMEQGWDPEVKKYLRKVLNTIAYGLLWLMSALTGGLYFQLAYHSNLFYAGLFYTLFLISLFLLIRYYYRSWKK
ncbi:MAG TPA: hypothetical protein VJ111_09395 [Chitinophagaceae bacterium]|nr:hypothetical protein [Chitinophagaceae bacterium]